MVDVERLNKAKELREEADRLEKEAMRPLPEKWKVGMRVRYLERKEFGWTKGGQGTVTELRKEYKNKAGHEYQVFYTKPDNGFTCWTTPNDVELVT